MSGATTPARWRVKARVLAGTVADLAVDMVLPTVVYLILRPLGVPALLALAAGGLVVGGKAQVGGIASRPRPRAWVGAAVQAGAGIAVMFGAYAAGVGAVYAMALGAVPVAAGVVVTMMRRGRVEGFALLVLCEVAAGIAVGLTSGDPRFVLARSSVYVAIAGVYALVSCFTPRPLMMVASKPMAVAGDPQRAVAF